MNMEKNEEKLLNLDFLKILWEEEKFLSLEIFYGGSIRIKYKSLSLCFSGNYFPKDILEVDFIDIVILIETLFKTCGFDLRVDTYMPILSVSPGLGFSIAFKISFVEKL